MQNALQKLGWSTDGVGSDIKNCLKNYFNIEPRLRASFLSSLVHILVTVAV